MVAFEGTSRWHLDAICMEETVLQGEPGAHIGPERFTDLDCADDMTLLSKMFEILILC